MTIIQIACAFIATFVLTPVVVFILHASLGVTPYAASFLGLLLIALMLCLVYNRRSSQSTGKQSTNQGRAGHGSKTVCCAQTGCGTSTDSSVPPPGGKIKNFAGKTDAIAQQPTGELPIMPKAGVKRLSLVGANQMGTAFRMERDKDRYIDVETEVLDNGAVKVMVTVANYLSREFRSSIMPQLADITTIAWEKPINLGDLQQQVNGVIPRGANAGNALARLQEVA